MILNGKAKEDFENYVLNKELGHDSEVLISVYNQETLFIDYKDVKETLLNALIIEWFDSVGIYIIISPSDNPKNWFYTILGEDILSPFYQMYQSLDDFENRQEAIIQAIKKANEIYNSK